jgi:hypothetical protein
MLNDFAVRLTSYTTGAGQALAERDLLWMLCHIVRHFTLEQIAELRFADCKDPREMARQWVRRLERKYGLLEVRNTMLQPIPSLGEPLHIHSPGEAMHNAHSLSWRAQNRWQAAPPRPTLLVTATNEARRQYQHSLRLRRVRQTDLMHDVCVSQLYLNLIDSDLDSAASWIPEDRVYETGIHKFGQSIPDAIVIRPQVTLLEFVGKYSAKRLMAYHREFSDYKYVFY